MIMTGFFTKAETSSKTRPTGKVADCITCGAYKNCDSPKMKPYGNFKKQIMVIGNGLTDMDDAKGLPFQGSAGRFLQKALLAHRIDLFEDCVCLNAINCFTKNITPSTIEECRKIVLSAIEQYSPKLVLLLGENAVKVVIGSQWKKDASDISMWRGWTIPDQKLKTWLCPTFSNEYISKLDSTKQVDEIIWKKDLKYFASFVDKPFPVFKEPKIHIITDLSVLRDKAMYKNQLMVSPYAAFDYETTGLKPHDKQHRIVCASVAPNANNVYVFMMPETKRELKPFIEFLQDDAIRKIAQNMKYEHAWTYNKLGVEITSWSWDTMLATHCLDNRPMVTGLKFQTYVQFGVADYSSEIEPYFKSLEEKNANSINQIDKLLALPDGKEKLLTYCGYDSIFEYRLAMLQMPLILPKQPKV